jgi:hypothetical protein
MEVWLPDVAGKDPVTNLQDHLASPWTANFTTNSGSLNTNCMCSVHSYIFFSRRTACLFSVEVHSFVVV